MKAIQLDHISCDLEAAIEGLRLVDKPIPEPGPGQVLVKIEAAPCNPSDLLFLQGRYGVKKELPTVPGWEGAGTVVKSGRGLLGWWLKGKRVACVGQSNTDGTWAEYFVADAKACVPLHHQISKEQGATMIINPLTAIGMLEQTKREKHLAIIQTAACSQVGKMVQTLARKYHLPLINIVRREEQLEELRSKGEKWVLNSEDSEFIEKLKELAKELQATVVFEAVAGTLTGKILNAMPEHSKALVYGALSEGNCADISPLSLIFQDKKVEGFWLTKWIQEGGFLHIFQATREVQGLIESGEFRTKIRSVVGIDEWKSALLDYHHKMTAGKVILSP